MPDDRTRARGLAGQGGFAPGDAVLLLAAAVVVVALLWPRWERRAFEERVEATTRAVDAAREALVTAHRAGGDWPPGSEPGRVPLARARAAVGEGDAVRAAGATLQVRRWTLLAPPGTLPPDGSSAGNPSGRAPTDEATGPGAPPGPGAGEEGGSEPPAGDAEADGPGDGEPEGAATSLPRSVELAGITVHAAEPALLAALLRAYGRERSFVRDTTWTLVLAPASPAGGPDEGGPS
jgi:hypothetical protein